MHGGSWGCRGLLVGVLGASRNSRYSGTRKSIGGIRGIGGLLEGYRAIWGLLGGVRGVLGG